MELRDKVVLITGGASGIGRASALVLAEAGAVVVIADVDEDGGRAAAAAVEGHFVSCDVSDLEANRAAVAFAVETCGGLDVAFLNAGMGTGCGVGEDFDPIRYRRAMGVNLDGVVFGTHVALEALRVRGGGAILATASLAGLTAMPMDPIYTANKHAVVGLARALGPALAPDDVRFNALCPAFAFSALTAGMEGELRAAGFELIETDTVAGAVLQILAGDGTGECWFVQYGREPQPFQFRGVPGPRGIAPTQS
jgi:NAD(P)-dependent dehydrogenase (short-subunit alcohol dehydrogenase family)